MNTTTAHFQVKPDFFSSPEECLASERKTINTNPRYKFFNQTHFTAGDIEQFENYRDYTNDIVTDISVDKNLFLEKLPNIDWEKYRNLDPLSTTNTFNYIFHKFKKGIFIKINNGKIKTFLPFSKKNFTNEWHHLIKIDPKYTIYTFLEQIQKKEGRRFNPKSVNKFTELWYANNSLLRWEFPIAEGDTGNHPTSDMFKTLAECRQIPDLEFFVNRRDFPILKKDGTEPYDHIFGDNVKLLSHRYNKYCPILSMVGAENFADIPIPTSEDWARVCRKEGKFFPKFSTRNYSIKSTPWNKRKPIAVFRGSSTGTGVTIETNQRLKLAYLSKTTPPDTDGLPLLDAGITEWNLRPRKIKGEKYLKTIDIDNLPFKLVPPLSPQEQTNYKYIVNVNGHVCAYRLSLELESGACILFAESKYKLWYRHLLKPFVHYVPVREDLSDLLDQIKWCKENDQKCKKIAENAVEFASKYLTKDGILDYLQNLLYELKKINGTYIYNCKSLHSIIREKEVEILQDNFYPDLYEISELSSLPNYNRCYGSLKAMEWIVRMVLDKSSLKEMAKFKREIFNNKKTVISEYELANFCIATKTSDKSLVHEAFVTIQETNKLLKEIPNFAYTFGFSEKTNTIITEYIHGETFNDFIHGKNFNFTDYSSILLQLALALHVSQKNHFVHYDLTPWNIIIQKLPTYITFDYVIEYNVVYRVNTNIIPVIIDMGRSHVIHDDFHYGETNLFSTSTIQDIITILNTSIYEVSSLQLSQQDVKNLVTLANFISGTKYHQRQFRETGKNGLGDIRYFFGKAKKFSELVGSDKLDLEKKTPADFVKYLLTNFKFSSNVTVQITDTLVYTLNQGNPMQIFDFSFSKTVRERALSYARAIHNLEVPETKFLFETYYVAQNTADNLDYLYHDMIAYLEKENIEDKDKFIKKYNKAVKTVSERFKKLKDGKETFSWPIKNYPEISYSETTFLFPEKILDFLKAEKDEDYLYHSLDLVEEIICKKKSPYAVLPSSRKYYETFVQQIKNRKDEKLYVANMKTLRELATKLYSANVEKLPQKWSTTYEKILENLKK